MTRAEAPVASAPERNESPRVRLDYLDGLRGLAALYVCLFHAQMIMTWRYGGKELAEITQMAAIPFRFGRYAVAVFIVLSGYVLMLPVVRAADGRIRGGVLDYLKRRARRILPPYYAALALSALLIMSVPALHRVRVDPWDAVLPINTPGIILSHLLLVHNFSPGWILKFNGSLWSVATEWQIYFLFPALLLPLWRRLGVTAVVIAGLALGLVPHFLLNGLLDDAAPWFVGLFAMGMAAAVVNFSDRRIYRIVRERVPWAWLAVVFAVGFGAMVSINAKWVYETAIWAADICVGCAAMSLIIYCTRCLTANPGGAQPDIVEFLQLRGVAGLGAFSYSLYLMHAPVLGAVYLALQTTRLPVDTQFVLLFTVGVPFALVTSYLFHLAFERRFMPGHLRDRQEQRSAQPAKVSVVS